MDATKRVHFIACSLINKYTAATGKATAAYRANGRERICNYAQKRQSADRSREAEREYGGVIDEVVENITEVMFTLVPTLRVAGASRPRAQYCARSSRGLERNMCKRRCGNCGTWRRRISRTLRHICAPCFTIRFSPLIRKFHIKRRKNVISAVWQYAICSSSREKRRHYRQRVCKNTTSERRQYYS